MWSLVGKNFRRSKVAVVLSEHFPQIRSKTFWQTNFTPFIIEFSQPWANSNFRRVKSSVRQKGMKMRVRARRLSVNLVPTVASRFFREQKTP